MVDFSTLTYGDYIYPMEATVIGMFIALSSISMVPIVAVYKVCHLTGPIKEVLSGVILCGLCNKSFYLFYPAHPYTFTTE